MATDNTNERATEFIGATISPKGIFEKSAVVNTAALVNLTTLLF